VRASVAVGGQDGEVLTGKSRELPRIPQVDDAEAWVPLHRAQEELPTRLARGEAERGEEDAVPLDRPRGGAGQLLGGRLGGNEEALDPLPEELREGEEVLSPQRILRGGEPSRGRQDQEPALSRGDRDRRGPPGEGG